MEAGAKLLFIAVEANKSNNFFKKNIEKTIDMLTGPVLLYIYQVPRDTKVNRVQFEGRNRQKRKRQLYLETGSIQKNWTVARNGSGKAKERVKLEQKPGSAGNRNSES